MAFVESRYCPETGVQVDSLPMTTSNAQLESCNSCYFNFWNRLDDDRIPVAEFIEQDGQWVCQDIDECVLDASGLTPCGDPMLVNCQNNPYSEFVACTDVNECITANCGGDTPICLNAYNDATVVCANRNVVVKHKFGAWIWIQHESGSKWLKNAMTLNETQICGLTITNAYAPSDAYGGVTQTFVGDSSMFNVGSTYPLGSAAGDPGCP